MAKDRLLSSIPENTSALRLVREKKKGLSKDKQYKASFKVVDEITNKTMAECDLSGNVAFVTLEIRNEKNDLWKMRPNRKIMPSRWLVFDANGQCAHEIRRPGLFRAMKPFSRLFFYITDNNAKRTLKIEDLESSIGDLVFGSPPFRWSITEGGNIDATIERIARIRNEEPKKGFFKKLKQFFSNSDWVLLTPGSMPIFIAPVYLGLMLIIEEHSRNPGGID